MSTDFIRGNFTALGELHSKGQLPDFVKESGEIKPKDVEPLLDSAFADRMERRMPLHTKEATYLSALWYYGHEPDNPKIEDRIIKAADFHGVSKEVSEIPKALGYLEKKASGPEDAVKFALVVDRGPDRGGVQNYYPVSDSYEVVKSAREADFAFDDGRLPPEYFRAASVCICKRAEALGVNPLELPASVRQNGQEKLPDLERFKKMAVLTRRQAGVEEEALELYEKIAQGLSEGDSFQEAESLWNRMDQVCGIKYASDVPTFYEMVFNGNTLSRSDVEKYANTHVVVCGVPVPSNVLESIPESRVDAYFGEKQASDIKAVLELAKKDPTAATVKTASLEKEDEKTFLEMLYKWAV